MRHQHVVKLEPRLPGFRVHALNHHYVPISAYRTFQEKTLLQLFCDASQIFFFMFRS